MWHNRGRFVDARTYFFRFGTGNITIWRKWDKLANCLFDQSLHISFLLICWVWFIWKLAYELHFKLSLWICLLLLLPLWHLVCEVLQPPERCVAPENSRVQEGHANDTKLSGRYSHLWMSIDKTIILDLVLLLSMLLLIDTFCLVCQLLLETPSTPISLLQFGLASVFFFLM